MEEDTMTADEHAPNRKNKKSIGRSGGKKKKLRPQNGEITDGKNQFEQPDRSLGGNTRSPGMGDSQRTNSDQFTIIGINGNHELNREVNQFPGSSQLLHQQYQHLGLHHQIIMGKYDAELGKLTLEVQTLRDRMRKNSRKMKNLKAKLSSIETIPVPLEPQQTAQPQREPAKQLKKKKNRGSGSNHKNVDPAITSTTPTTKSVIFPKKLSESFQDISPNKMKRESEMVSLLSEHEDMPGIKIKQEKNSCPSCLSFFGDENLLTEHIKSSCPKNLCCQFCKKRFIRIKSLNLHLKTHERPTDLYKCPACKKSFAKEKVSEHHFWNHLVCIKCGYYFINGADLASHIKRFHFNLRAWVCRYCCKMINENEWDQHCQNCELNPQQTGICFYCNKFFITLLGLKCHIESKHWGLQWSYRRYLVPYWKNRKIRRASRLEYLLR